MNASPSKPGTSPSKDAEDVILMRTLESLLENSLAQKTKDILPPAEELRASYASCLIAECAEKTIENHDLVSVSLRRVWWDQMKNGYVQLAVSDMLAWVSFLRRNDVELEPYEVQIKTALEKILSYQARRRAAIAKEEKADKDRTLQIAREAIRLENKREKKKEKHKERSRRLKKAHEDHAALASALAVGLVPVVTAEAACEPNATEPASENTLYQANTGYGPCLIEGNCVVSVDNNTGEDLCQVSLNGYQMGPLHVQICSLDTYGYDFVGLHSFDPGTEEYTQTMVYGCNGFGETKPKDVENLLLEQRSFVVFQSIDPRSRARLCFSSEPFGPGASCYSGTLSPTVPVGLGTASPTTVPSVSPTSLAPTVSPTSSVPTTDGPTWSPTESRTPTGSPSPAPSNAPSLAPTMEVVSQEPSQSPTQMVSLAPSAGSESPTASPVSGTGVLTMVPSSGSGYPSYSPSAMGTLSPSTRSPSMISYEPTVGPTSEIMFISGASTHRFPLSVIVREAIRPDLYGSVLAGTASSFLLLLMALFGWNWYKARKKGLDQFG